jgi:hypothetical protein
MAQETQRGEEPRASASRVDRGFLLTLISLNRWHPEKPFKGMSVPVSAVQRPGISKKSQDHQACWRARFFSIEIAPLSLA